jgi:hypothetical protein
MSLAVIVDSKLVWQCPGRHTALETNSESSGQPQSQTMDQAAVQQPIRSLTDINTKF